MKKIKGLRKRWYMLRDLLGMPSKKYNYKNKYGNFGEIKDNGLKFYGQFNPSVDQFIFNRYFNDINIMGTCIECGALDGLTDSSCKFFEETMGWECYNFEPMPHNFKMLEENRPNSHNINLAMSDKNGETEFNFELVEDEHGNTSCAGNGSLNKYTDGIKSSIAANNHGVSNVKVKTITYRDFIKKYKVKHIDLFVLDVEGHELSVMDGMEKCEVLPDIMCVEINDKKEFPAIREKMDELGYVYDITSFVNYYFIKKDKLELFNFRREGR